MLSTISNCPECSAALKNQLQTICYDCGCFLIPYRVRLEYDNRKLEVNKLKAHKPQKWGEITEHVKLISTAESRMKEVFDDGINLLKARQRILNKRAEELSADEKFEAENIEEQITAIEGMESKEAPLLAITRRLGGSQPSPDTVIEAFKKAAQQAKEGFAKGGDTQGALGMVAGFFEGLSEGTRQIESKSEIDKTIAAYEESKTLIIKKMETHKDRLLKAYEICDAIKRERPKDGDQVADELMRIWTEKGLI